MTSVRRAAFSAVWVILLLSSAGCRTVPASLVRSSGGADAGIRIGGLVSCGQEPGELELDRDRPMVLFVPEAEDQGVRWGELAWRFSRDGAQSACFEHPGRERLEASSSRLVQALQELKTRLAPSRIVIVAHGIGGLIARRALTRERPDALRGGDGFTYLLVTVATPFGGVRSAADCGRTWLHALTLGTSALACSLVAGGSWDELPPTSAFVTRPGTLLPEVEEHLQIVTEEHDACQRRAWDRSCLVPDKVFSVGEQRNAAIERDPRLRRVEVVAGHTQIVGQPGIPPTQLVSVLESQGLLGPSMRVATP